jgi:hypothetical protein
LESGSFTVKNSQEQKKTPGAMMAGCLCVPVGLGPGLEQPFGFVPFNLTENVIVQRSAGVGVA